RPRSAPESRGRALPGATRRARAPRGERGGPTSGRGAHRRSAVATVRRTARQCAGVESRAGRAMADAKVSADALLARLKEKERARLRIYIGAAPGVGKTYALLREAHALRARGLDVAIGLIETYGR